MGQGTFRTEQSLSEAMQDLLEELESASSSTKLERVINWLASSSQTSDRPSSTPGSSRSSLEGWRNQERIAFRGTSPSPEARRRARDSRRHQHSKRERSPYLSSTFPKSLSTRQSPSISTSSF